MPKYTFTVRKGGCEISLVTDDRDAIEQQIAIWVLALSRRSQEVFTPETAQEPRPFIPEPIEETALTEVFNNPQDGQASADLLQENEIQRDNNSQTAAENEPEQGGSEIQPDFSQPSQDNPDLIDGGQPAPPAEVFENPTPHDADSHLQNDAVQEGTEHNFVQMADKVEEFVNTLDKTDVMTAESRKEQENAITINNLFNAESPANVDFESILEHSVDNISNDSVIKKDEIFCKLVKANNITDRLELLLFTADYFCKYDARFTFSLKQINGKLMHNLAVIVDHGILKIALDNNYLERAGESEYRLTEYGRSEIYSKAGIWS